MHWVDMSIISIASFVKKIYAAPRAEDGREGVLAADVADDDPVQIFEKRLQSEFERIENALEALKSDPRDTSHNTVLFQRVQDLTDQARPSGYKLISQFGDELCQFLTQPVVMTTRRLKVVRLYIDALKQVADKKLMGDGQKPGEQMIRRIQSMIQMVLQGEEALPLKNA